MLECCPFYKSIRHFFGVGFRGGGEGGGCNFYFKLINFLHILFLHMPYVPGRNPLTVTDNSHCIYPVFMD